LELAYDPCLASGLRRLEPDYLYHYDFLATWEYAPVDVCREITDPFKTHALVSSISAYSAAKLENITWWSKNILRGRSGGKRALGGAKYIKVR